MTEYTTIEARDKIINSFSKSQFEAFKAIGEKIGKKHSLDEIRDNLINAAYNAFNYMGADYNEPTKEDLSKILPQIISLAGSWGIPETVIQQRKKELVKVLENTKDPIKES